MINEFHNVSSELTPSVFRGTFFINELASRIDRDELMAFHQELNITSVKNYFQKII